MLLISVRPQHVLGPRRRHRHRHRHHHRALRERRRPNHRGRQRRDGALGRRTRSRRFRRRSGISGTDWRSSRRISVFGQVRRPCRPVARN